MGCKIKEAAVEMLEAYDKAEAAKGRLLEAAVRLERALEESKRKEGKDAD